jgi:hypothetical protein
MNLFAAAAETSRPNAPLLEQGASSLQMCDYSLYTVKNRLACESDDLILHRFDTGSLGFCAAVELQQEMDRSDLARGWSSFQRWMFPRKKCGLTAVCVPPGAQLLVLEVPKKTVPGFQAQELESVEFTQLSERSFAYRDALRFPGGETVLLQSLPEGLRVTVMALASEEEVVVAAPVKERMVERI